MDEADASFYQRSGSFFFSPFKGGRGGFIDYGSDAAFGCYHYISMMQDEASVMGRLRKGCGHTGEVG